MSDTDQSLLSKVEGVAGDATVDTNADGFINTAIDDVASHVPGGSALDGGAKTGIDLAANNAINGEIGNLEGMFGRKDG